MSSRGIPQIAVVMGSCTAGGGVCSCNGWRKHHCQTAGHHLSRWATVGRFTLNYFWQINVFCALCECIIIKLFVFSFTVFLIFNYICMYKLLKSFHWLQQITILKIIINFLITVFEIITSVTLFISFEHYYFYQVLVFLCFILITLFVSIAFFIQFHFSVIVVIIPCDFQVKAATGEEVSAEDLGGADLHCRHDDDISFCYPVKQTLILIFYLLTSVQLSLVLA